jgi:serine/threonine-protein kinase
MIGKRIQNYEIRSFLGEGGMGTVYRAGDSVLAREVALKMLHAPLLQQPLFLDRFKKEARLLAQLLHPNIAVIYNMIEQDSNHFMVMEYVEGKNLDALLRQYQMLSYKVVVPVFIQALEGLGHAHKKNIFHRDIKPSNLILTPDGTVKLMDFGIAMMAGEQRLTQVNRVVGTVEYIAPEIIQGKEPSVATDLYAMGVTMYELLTGKLPFEGNTDYNLMQDILKKKPLAVEKMNASVPRALSNIVMKALEKKPADRFAGAKEFQQALLAAFPDLKYAELDEHYITSAGATHAPATVQVNRVTLKPTALLYPKTAMATQAMGFLKTLKAKTLAKENRLVVACIFLIAATAIFAFVFRPAGGGAPKMDNTQQSNAIKAKDSTEPEKQKEVREETVVFSEQPPKNGPVTVLPPAREPVNEKKKEPVKERKPEDDKKKKEEEKKPDIKKPEEKKINPPVEDDKKEEPKPVEKKIPHSIKLTSGVDIGLYLREPIDATSAQSGQTLNFMVTAPVRYNGEVIIERGANARGVIKSAGKKKISIVIISVTAANGQSLPVQEKELSGRIDEIVKSRNYSATLKKGITINF